MNVGSSDCVCEPIRTNAQFFLVVVSTTTTKKNITKSHAHRMGYGLVAVLLPSINNKVEKCLFARIIK